MVVLVSDTNVILRTPWLASLGLVLWNVAILGVSFRRDNRIMAFNGVYKWDGTSNSPHPASTSVNPTNTSTHPASTSSTVPKTTTTSSNMQPGLPADDITPHHRHHLPLPHRLQIRQSQSARGTTSCLSSSTP